MLRERNEKELKVYFNKSRNTWFAPYTTFDSEKGKQVVHKKSFKTKEEALDFLQELEYKKNSSIFVENNGIPINKLMRKLNDRKFKMQKLSEQQYSKNNKIIEAIEATELGRKDICNISAEEIQAYFDSLTHYSSNYMKKFILQFSQAFRYAKEKNYISVNPMVDVYIPKSDKPKKIIRSLEIEEQDSLTKYLMSKSTSEEPYRNAFLIQMYMGLRIGEVLALQYDDIDFVNNVVHVNKTLTRDQYDNVIIGDSTKTPAGVRLVPIPHNIRNNLLEQKEISKNNKYNLLFVNKKGGISDPRNVNYILKRIVVKVLKTPDISTHSLRHTFGTRCIEAGMQPVTVQRLMGHSDIGVTLNTYTSILNRFKKEELLKVEKYYNGIFKNSDSKDDFER